MMKNIYNILTLLLLIFIVACGEEYNGDSGQSVEIVDGKIKVCFDIHTKEVQNVQTKSDTPEDNVFSGWGFVFAADPDEASGYGDNSELLQKIKLTVNEHNQMFFLFNEYEGACFFRIMANLTDEAVESVKALVSKEDVDAGEAAQVSTFKDYKDLTVGLEGYYDMTGVSVPTPSNLQSSFPMASPGISMPDGVTENSLHDIDKNIYMVMVGSKVQVSVDENCDFELLEVTLLNGASRAYVRSTVLQNDGVTPLFSRPLPYNLGGVVQYAVARVSESISEPIYFYPNEGGNVGDSEINPTYLIVKGIAKNYGVEGYYKIPIRGIYPTDTEQVLTYDIIRNTFFHIRLSDVVGAGYKTFADAVDNPATDMNYDVVLDGESNCNELLVSNGSFYAELIGSEVFMAGYGDEGGVGQIEIIGHSSDGFDVPNIYVEGSGGVVVTAGSTIASPVDGERYTISFHSTASGEIELRIGDILRRIPVVYESGAYTKAQDDLMVEGSRLSFGGYWLESGGEAILSGDGYVLANATYSNREFRGGVYPTDMSRGIIKLYCKQASEFDLWNDNTSALAKSSQSIVYQSTGNIYTITDGTANTSAKRSYSVKGESILFSSSGTLSDFNASEISSSTTSYSFYAGNVGTGQSGSVFNASLPLNYIQNQTITLSNIAGETKSYTLDVKQYFAPFFEHSDNPCYGGCVDCYGSGNQGDKMHACRVYNGVYASGDYVWESDVWQVTEWVLISANQENSYTWLFTGTARNTVIGWPYSSKSSVFKVHITNLAGESFYKRVNYKAYHAGGNHSENTI